VVVPAETLQVEGSDPADTTVAHPGARGRELFRIRFVHPGADTLGPIRVDAFRFRAERADGDTVEMRSLVAQVRAMLGESLLATLAPLTEGAATLLVTFGEPVLLDPGDSADVRVVADLRADAEPDDYRLAVPATGIDARDAVAETKVEIRFTGSDSQLFRTGPLHVRMISERIDVAIDLRLPPTTVGGASIDDAGAVRFRASGGSGTAVLPLSSFSVVVEDEKGNGLSPERALAEATVRSEESEEEIPGVFGGEEIAFSFDPPLSVAPEETLALFLALRVAEEPDIGSFRIRFPLESVETGEVDPAVVRAEGDGGSNPSAPTHLAGRDFAESLRNYPNPFASGREETTIAFYSRSPGRAVLRVFTGLGVPVRSWEETIESPGLVETKWDGRNGDGREVLSGVYLASVEVVFDDGSKEHGIHKIAVVR
jgi:hypothetical protein